MPPALDVETRHLDTIIAEEGVTRAWEFINRWCELVKQGTGYTPLLYMSKRGADRLQFNFGSLPAFDLWMPRYRNVNNLPPLPLDANGHLVWPMWQFWQHSETGRVAGIRGNVDLNLFNGDTGNFNGWLQSVQPKPAVQPNP
jgi:lysozyme